MSDLTDFVNQRIVGVRGEHVVDYQADARVPNTAVALTCETSGLTLWVVPLVTPDLMWFETHAFVDGEYTPITYEPAATADGRLNFGIGRRVG